jgi:tetratricopeptide (TPR) repeat protein
VPPQAEAILMQALAHEPNRRYATAQALAEDLERFRRGERVRARGASWVGQHKLMAAGLAVAALAVLAVPVWYLGFSDLGGTSDVRPAPLNGVNGVPTAALSPEQMAEQVGTARRELADGRAEEAARRLRDLLQRTGSGATRDARLLAARAYRLTHDLAAAERELAAVLAADVGSSSADARCEQGLLALAEGRAEDAVAELDQALAAKPDAETAEAARAGKGEALLRLGKADEARAVLEEAGTTGTTLALLAEARLALGDADGAVETARRASTQPAAPVWAQVVLGAALEAQGKPEDARKTYSQAATSRVLGDRRAELARDRLKMELERLGGVAPKELNAIEQEIRANQGPMEEAKLTALWERCSRALDRSYSDTTAVRLRLWRMRLGRALGKGAEAMADADVLLAPRSGLDATTQLPAYEVRANLRFDAGDFAGAIADATAVIDRRRASGGAGDPNHEAVLLGMLTIRGRAWAAFGDFQAAAKDADDALALVARQESRRGRPEHLSALVVSAFGNGWLGQAQTARTIYEQLKPLRQQGENDVGMALIRGAIAAADRQWDDAAREFGAEAANERSAYRAVAERSLAMVRAMRR